jgi:hypothetical protein
MLPRGFRNSDALAANQETEDMSILDIAAIDSRTADTAGFTGLRLDRAR